MDTASNVSKMRVMGIATVIDEVMNGTLPRLEDRSPSSQFSLRLEACKGDKVVFGMLVRDGFSDEVVPDYEMDADFTFECGKRYFCQDFCEAADRFDEASGLVRSCYQDDDKWGEELAHELEASAALLRLETLWSEGEEVWSARGDELAGHGNETLAEIARRFDELTASE